MDISPYALYLTPVKSRRKIIHRLNRIVLNIHFPVNQVNFIHSRAVREKNTGKLVFELTSTLQTVLGVPTAWLEILSVENFPKGVRRLS